MFGQFFVKSILLFFITLLLALILVDDLYLQSISQDEITYTKGIQRIVGQDLLTTKNVSARISYWNQQFPYEFSLASLSSLDWSFADIKALKESGNFVEITSGWLTDEITVNYFYPACECVLKMHKLPASNETWITYLQVLFACIIAILGCFVFWHTFRHKRYIQSLSDTYARYGSGQFEVRAEEKIPLPYTPLATNFNQMAEKIHELLQEQKVMVNGISHDIRTPIARLRFALDLTRNCQTVEALRQHIQDMDMDLDELDQLIKDWLFYAGLTSTAKQITFDTRVEISSLLMEKTNSFAPMYPNIRVISAIEPLNVLGNQRLLSRCIENILSNAFKFARNDVSVGAESTKEGIAITIEDDGPGIADASLESIVQPFVKLRSQAPGESYGLGLAIVKTIVKQHKAELGAGNSKLGGARFTVLFPHRQVH